MVSCLQLNTPESFTRATHIYNNLCTQKEKSLSKIVHPYVLLASKQGHIEEAYEILNYLHKPKRGVIRSGLRISLLVKMNRLDEAIRVLEQIVKGKVIYVKQGGRVWSCSRARALRALSLLCRTELLKHY